MGPASWPLRTTAGEADAGGTAAACTIAMRKMAVATVADSCPDRERSQERGGTYAACALAKAELGHIPFRVRAHLSAALWASSAASRATRAKLLEKRRGLAVIWISAQGLLEKRAGSGKIPRGRAKNPEQVVTLCARPFLERLAREALGLIKLAMIEALLSGLEELRGATSIDSGCRERGGCAGPAFGGD